MEEQGKKDRHGHRVSFTIPEADWDEFGEILAGSPDDRSVVLRRMVAAFLKRPKVKIPRRADYER